MSVNITEVRLLSVPLEEDYKHTLYFASKDAQTTYFKSKAVKTLTDFSYQRKDNYIRVPFHIDTLLGKVNYVMYKNSAYSSKWFYAFITKMEYKGDETTFIYISTDVIQTWAFDITIKPSFVEREHVNDDTIGAHTVPEGLETGEYIVNGNAHTNSMKSGAIILASTVNLSDLDKDKCDMAGGAVYGGVYSGVYYYYFKTEKDSSTEYLSSYDAISAVLNRLAKMGQSDAIIGMFIVPSEYVNLASSQTVEVASGDLPIKLQKLKSPDTFVSKMWNAGGSGDSPIYKPTTINGYTPRNNKLFTFPYCYLNMSNNAGGNAIYHYEKFNSADTCAFYIYFTPCAGGSLRVVPVGYNGYSINYEEGLTGAKYPICSWLTDMYTNWLTQNSVNLGISYATGALQIVGGMAAMLGTGGAGAVMGGGSIVGGISTIANTMAEKYQRSLVPPQAEGNLNSGDIAFASGNLRFSAYGMTIKAEYAKIIDGYFDMFGYKVNLCKKPNENHRAKYWFTKTIDISIDGAIPNEDMQKIKNCYNSGITFWRNAGDIGDYSVDNSII